MELWTKSYPRNPVVILETRLQLFDALERLQAAARFLGVSPSLVDALSGAPGTDRKGIHWHNNQGRSRTPLLRERPTARDEGRLVAVLASKDPADWFLERRSRTPYRAEETQPDNSDALRLPRQSQTKLNMMREALDRLDRKANEHGESFGTIKPN